MEQQEPQLSGIEPLDPMLPLSQERQRVVLLERKFREALSGFIGSPNTPLLVEHIRRKLEEVMSHGFDISVTHDAITIREKGEGESEGPGR